LDLSGKVIREFNHSAIGEVNVFYINATSLAPAIYLLKIIPEGGTPLTRQIMIK
jgi:hypothetical protein